MRLYNFIVDSGLKINHLEKKCQIPNTALQKAIKSGGKSKEWRLFRARYGKSLISHFLSMSMTIQAL